MRRVINDFSAGELSPLLAGMGNNESVQRGCVDALNCYVLPSGGLVRRPSMMHLGDAGGRSVLIPFRYSATDGAMLEIQPFGLQVWGSDGAPQGGVIPCPWSEAELPTLQWVTANNLVLVTCPTVPPHRIQRIAPGVWESAPVVWDWPPLRQQNVSDVTLTFTPDVPGNFGVGSVGTLSASADTFFDSHALSLWEIGTVRERPFKKLALGEGSAKASAILSMTAHPADGEQVSIDGKVYTFKATAAAAYEVDRGANAAAARAKLIEAINGDVPGTPAHPSVAAEDAGAVAAGTFATATLTITNQPGVGVTVTVGAVTVTAVSGAPAAGQFQIGASKEATLDNIITALNATLVNAAMQPRVGNQSVCRATTAGVAGNSIAVAETSTWLSWSSATLTGGVDSNTERVRIEARASGADGNGKLLSETLAAGSWSRSETTGGITISAQSEWLRVVGKWEVFSVGEWYGEVRLVTSRGETLRVWAGEGDFNIQANGTVQDETLRLEFTGSGTFSATPGLNAPNPRAQLTAVDAEVRGIVRIDTYFSPTEVRATITKPLQDGAATARWAEAAFSGYRGHPRALCFHEQRLILGGVEGSPLTVWGSVTSDLFNFRRTGLDDGGFSYDLAGTDSAPIAWMASQNRGLVVGTESGEWIMAGSGDAGITPNAVEAKQQTAYGSAGVRPVMAGGSVLFVQSGARTIREFVFAWDQQNFVAPDILELSEHLAWPGILGVAVAKKPFTQVFVVLADGRMLACTYRRAEGGTMIAWTPLQTDGTILSAAVLGGNAEDDQVWMVVERSGGYRIERFAIGQVRGVKRGIREDFTHLDSCSQHAGSTLTGLDRFNGQEVNIQIDGGEAIAQVVTGGTVTLSEAATKAFVGIPFETRIRPMAWDTPMEDGGSSGRKQKLAMLSVLLHASGPLEYQDGPGGAWYPLQMAAGEEGGIPPLVTGWRRLEVQASHRDGIEVTVRTFGTSPLNLLAMSCAYAVYGA
jgi:hypothetical protein